MSTHQQRWDEALATEHSHQQELLATLRGELGAVARECAGALTALETFVGGLSEAASLASAAQRGYAQAKLVRDLALTMPGDTAEGRSDRDLLERVCADESVRAELERALGPAPVAALRALQPLSRWIPAVASIRRGQADAHELAERATGDLIRVLGATGELTGSEGELLAAQLGSLGGALRDTLEHVEGAARAVRSGKLEQVLAEARATLEGDLEALRRVIDEADEAGADWLRARRSEHEELSEEVRDKLDRVERIRRVLGLILPHLEAVARSLATTERVLQVEHRLHPDHAVAAEASRLTLLLDLSSLWHVVLPSGGATPPPRRVTRRTRWLAVAAFAILLGGGVAIALADSGGDKTRTTAEAPVTTAAAPATSSSTSTDATPVAPVPPAVTPVSATFDEAQRATFYTVSAEGAGQGEPTFDWELTPPKTDPSCDDFAVVDGKPNEAVWRHADTDGCDHTTMGPAGHPGTVTVTVKTDAWECTATFFGSNTNQGPPARRCHRL
jgi:hypothetical protein